MPSSLVPAILKEKKKIKTRSNHPIQSKIVPNSLVWRSSIGLQPGPKSKAELSQFSTDTIWYELNRAARHGFENYAHSFGFIHMT